ncbi:MAG: glycerophosphodiester phosphodiesterase [Actinobacteria bacterium]|nr:glycerophosphodiester phosphodiesterase [Actinomycetota bacterium]
MAAFAEAVELGYRYLETDVHATADGVLVAFHDERLDRVTDGDGAIAEMDWAEVSEARIGGREPVPRLEEILGTWPEVRVNIDLKSDPVVTPFVDLLRRRDVFDRVCVGSFADARVAAVRAEFGDRVCTSAGPGEARRLRVASYLGLLGRLVPVGCDCLQVPVEHDGTTVVDQRMVDHCHGRGVPVHVWTVNDPVEMRRLLDLGVDGIVTDETRELRRVLRARGQWPAPAASS